MISVSKPIIGEEEISAVNKVLKSGNLAQGELVNKLEEEFAKYCGAKYAVAVNSGTAAIHAGLYALGITPGDEVITTPFTFVATANPILMLGAKVVFADISEKDFNINPEKIERKITNKTKAIIPVDLFGQLCDYEKIEEIAKNYNLNTLEDACQAIGARQNNRMAGNFGNVSVFSLYATKNITCGEGGMIVTNDKKIAEKCKIFRHHGQSEEKYEYLDLGYNYRMTDLAATIALEQLKKLDEFNKKRQENANKLTGGLKDIKGIVTPKVNAGNAHAFNQYTIRVTGEFKITRDELIEVLSKKGVGSSIYYPKPLHLHAHFQKTGYKKGDFPVAEKVAKEVISLPVGPSLSKEEISYIIKTIQAI